MLRKMKEQKEMDSKIKTNISSHQSDPRSENEPNYLSRLETSKTNKIMHTADELIASLQNHRENRRARQVFEWEAKRRRTPNYL